MARARGISKDTAYLNRIYTIEYDLASAINAYGLQFCHWLLDEIASGRVNCKQDVDRWSAHIALHKNYNFEEVESHYGTVTLRRKDVTDYINELDNIEIEEEAA